VSRLAIRIEVPGFQHWSRPAQVPRTCHRGKTVFIVLVSHGPETCKKRKLGEELPPPVSVFVLGYRDELVAVMDHAARPLLSQSPEGGAHPHADLHF